MKVSLLCLRRKEETSPTDDEWVVSGSEGAQWVNKLDIMEDKIKKWDANLKFWADLEVARQYSVDFTNPVEWYEEIIAELPWKVRHGRALADQQVATNLEAATLTQRLMTVTHRAVTLEKAIRALEAERSALFASMDGRCLEKLESILEEYSAYLIYAPARWALMRELIQKDGISPALSRVNHQLEGTGLRLDFHFTPTKPSLGRTSCSRPSTEEHWWRVLDAESVTISKGVGNYAFCSGKKINLEFGNSPIDSCSRRRVCL